MDGVDGAKTAFAAESEIWLIIHTAAAAKGISYSPV